MILVNFLIFNLIQIKFLLVKYWKCNFLRCTHHFNSECIKKVLRLLFCTNEQTFIDSTACYCIFSFSSRCSFYCMFIRSFVIRIICVYFRLHWTHWSRNSTTTPFYLLFTPKIVKKIESKGIEQQLLLDDQMGWVLLGMHAWMEFYWTNWVL